MHTHTHTHAHAHTSAHTHTHTHTHAPSHSLTHPLTCTPKHREKRMELGGRGAVRRAPRRRDAAGPSWSAGTSAAVRVVVNWRNTNASVRPRLNRRTTSRSATAHPSSVCCNRIFSKASSSSGGGDRLSARPQGPPHHQPSSLPHARTIGTGCVSMPRLLVCACACARPCCVCVCVSVWVFVYVYVGGAACAHLSSDDRRVPAASARASWSPCAHAARHQHHNNRQKE
jgi:hypothetical protein